MSGYDKKVFGDYQTPPDFCKKVCKYIDENHLADGLNTALEPTCGIGNFLKATSENLKIKQIYGVEIQPGYVEQARNAVPCANISLKNIFDVNTNEVCNGEDTLVIGNPPWVNNSGQTNNLPQKANFKGLRGIDAITGSANFDICEYIILKLISEHKNTNSVICMLCKMTVARNVLQEIARNKIAYSKIEMLQFDSLKVFGVSAAACVLIIALSPTVMHEKVTCALKEFDTGELVETLTIVDGKIKTTVLENDFEGICQLPWRQGVKHDCGKVMELKRTESGLFNKHGECVKIEDALVFPLVKSSDFKKPVLRTFSRYVIVTQRKPKEDTGHIKKECPATWGYLENHEQEFKNRKSIIYKNAPSFAMFGVGEYSFAPYKVGVSGFYKKPMFSLLYANKPVMTDDTSYFLSFYEYDIAYSMMLLLNSEKVQSFLRSIAFLDSKRPYTKKLLSRVDLLKCIEHTEFGEIKRTESQLGLNNYITANLYRQLDEFIHLQQDTY